jgi:hypothetical protein
LKIFKKTFGFNKSQKEFGKFKKFFKKFPGIVNGHVPGTSFFWKITGPGLSYVLHRS